MQKRRQMYSWRRFFLCDRVIAVALVGASEGRFLLAWSAYLSCASYPP
jgi:hypothetical protein